MNDDMDMILELQEMEMDRDTEMPPWCSAISVMCCSTACDLD